MPDKVMDTIYLDHAAATPLAESVLLAMVPHLHNNYGNPSSIHHIGRMSFDTLHTARADLAHALAVDPKEIILTGSGTESANLAIIGLARAHRSFGNHVIVSSIEHKAVLKSAKFLETEGFRVTYLPVDKTGMVDLVELDKTLDTETILVSIMYANNEIGTVEPISEIAELLQKKYRLSRKPLFHTDACQAAGQLPVSPRQLGVDAMTINSSKMYGPKGIGLLYLKDNIALASIIFGGNQEHGRRAGTENIALAVGFATALKTAVDTTDANAASLTALRERFIEQLNKHVSPFTLNGHPTKRLPNNIHICIPDIEGEAATLLLSQAGICAATGSACNSSDLEPSHVLKAIGRDDNLIHGSLRFSLGKNNTTDEIDHTAMTLGKIVHRLRSISATPIIYRSHYVRLS